MEAQKATTDVEAGDQITADGDTHEVIYANDYEVRISELGRFPLPYVQACIDDGTYTVA